ncbi:hypothetical protein LCGC14_2053020 [marine sediment metagenome]|uniref:Uncharacterized protein n=1 Tax=marine sediment metagenome TaxID=412755 RepID=A0A0F9ENJ6_9ZZZZ
MSDSKKWHKHKDGVYHKVEADRETHRKLPGYFKDVKFGTPFTRAEINKPE